MTLLARLPLAASGWITLLCTTLVADAAPLRIAVVAGYLLLCPGAAVLRPLRPALLGSGPDPAADPDERGAVAAQQLLLLVMLSLSALVVASTALMLAGVFSGSRTLVALAALTTAAALCPPLRPDRRPKPPRTPPAPRTARG